MAEFKRSYESTEEMKGDHSMDDGVGLGAGFLGGVILGGLGGYALSTNNRNRWGDFPPYPVNFGAPAFFGTPGFAAGVVAGEAANAYSTADVANIVATKDAQYAQLSTSQQNTYEILNTMSRDNTAMAKDLCGLAYEMSNINTQTQRQIADVSAKSDLCCCKTQGEIALTACQTQGMIKEIVPEIKNFYLQDEVSKLRMKELAQENACGFNAISNQLGVVGFGVNKIIEKLYPATTAPTTTTTTTTA